MAMQSAETFKNNPSEDLFLNDCDYYDLTFL